jgi:hypothetical protein
MAKRAKSKKTQTLSDLTKNNPNVDQKIVEESLLLIGHLRKIGVKPRGFNILRISESRLRIKNPAVYHLKMVQSITSLRSLPCFTLMRNSDS